MANVLDNEGRVSRMGVQVLFACLSVSRIWNSWMQEFRKSAEKKSGQDDRKTKMLSPLKQRCWCRRNYLSEQKKDKLSSVKWYGSRSESQRESRISGTRKGRDGQTLTSFHESGCCCRPSSLSCKWKEQSDCYTINTQSNDSICSFAAASLLCEREKMRQSRICWRNGNRILVRFSDQKRRASLHRKRVSKVLIKKIDRFLQVIVIPLCFTERATCTQTHIALRTLSWGRVRGRNNRKE